MKSHLSEACLGQESCLFAVSLVHQEKTYRPITHKYCPGLLLISLAKWLIIKSILVRVCWNSSVCHKPTTKYTAGGYGSLPKALKRGEQKVHVACGIIRLGLLMLHFIWRAARSEDHQGCGPQECPRSHGTAASLKHAAFFSCLESLGTLPSGPSDPGEQLLRLNHPETANWETHWDGLPSMGAWDMGFLCWFCCRFWKGAHLGLFQFTPAIQQGHRNTNTPFSPPFSSTMPPSPSPWPQPQGVHTFFQLKVSTPVLVVQGCWSWRVCHVQLKTPTPLQVPGARMPSSHPSENLAKRRPGCFLFEPPSWPDLPQLLTFGDPGSLGKFLQSQLPQSSPELLRGFSEVYMPICSTQQHM